MTKQHSSMPRHKRMARTSRLQAAQHWLPKYLGKNLVKGYRKHFGVDWLCAVTELQMLGCDIAPEYIEQLRKSAEGLNKERQQCQLKKQQEAKVDLYSDSDETYYFIAGYTSNGVPFGVSWEEISEEQAEEDIL